ncbi:MAG: tetratricopeptide repeat protein [Kofleriaceae bacterium]
MAPRGRLERELLAPLRREGYVDVVDATDAAERDLLARAARAAVGLHRDLPAAYYLGRDLLALGDAHLGQTPELTEDAPQLGRANELLAAGDTDGARPLLERAAALRPDDPEIASSLGLCLLACGEVPAARAWLERAATLAPSWPLHHWNAAAAAQRAGDQRACQQALRGYLRHADAAAAALDPEQPRRRALAHAMVRAGA